ncbi:MAG: histidinol-phosphatase HisJ family protein [Abditibacteriota bacterium]|nr:histidinol-phosphatase HisJ family protein [Abditibacteriota bacterium]
MKRIDYHVHTALSGDNTQTAEQLGKAALAKGLDEICLTEHVDFNPEDTCYGAFETGTHKKNGEYLSSLGIICRLGCEIDHQPQYRDKIIKTINSFDFDYVMGSTHYVDNMVVFHHDEYFEGKTEKEAYEKYFLAELESIRTGLFDSVAHFDLIKRWGSRFYGPFRPAPYMDAIDECLKELVKRNMGLELNSAGTRQDPGDFYPHRDILARYRELGGELVTFGSDCHRPEHLALKLEEAAEYLFSLGFRYMCTWEKRRPSFFDIKDP